MGEEEERREAARETTRRRTDASPSSVRRLIERLLKWAGSRALRLLPSLQVLLWEAADALEARSSLIYELQNALKAAAQEIEALQRENSELRAHRRDSAWYERCLVAERRVESYQNLVESIHAMSLGLTGRTASEAVSDIERVVEDFLAQDPALSSDKDA